MKLEKKEEMWQILWQAAPFAFPPPQDQIGYFTQIIQTDDQAPMKLIRLYKQ